MSTPDMDLHSLLNNLKNVLDILRELNSMWLYARGKSWMSRKWLVRPINQKRATKGFFNNLYPELKKDKKLFFQYTRMDVPTFQYILTLTKPFLLKRKAGKRYICPEERLILTIRYLASGDEVLTLALLHRIGQSTAYNVIVETCSAIHRALGQIYLRPPTTQAWRNICKGFNDDWNFPNCLGAIDGKHIAITAPPNSGSYFYNYKGFYSVVLLAVCNHRYEFTVVNIGAFGGESDGGIFARSEFGKRLEEGTFNLPAELRSLPNSNIKLPHFFVGDEAFPLKTFMMRPFPGRKLDYNKRVFNYRLSRARRCIENSFGILSSRWRVLKKPISCYVSHVDEIIFACVCLHNCLMARSRKQEKKPQYSTDNLVDGGIVNDRIETLQQNLANTSHLESSKQAYDMREKLTTYFVSSAGEVSWQRDYVTRGLNRDT